MLWFLAVFFFFFLTEVEWWAGGRLPKKTMEQMTLQLALVGSWYSVGVVREALGTCSHAPGRCGLVVQWTPEASWNAQVSANQTQSLRTKQVFGGLGFDIFGVRGLFAFLNPKEPILWVRRKQNLILTLIIYNLRKSLLE